MDNNIRNILASVDQRFNTEQLVFKLEPTSTLQHSNMVRIVFDAPSSLGSSVILKRSSTGPLSILAVQEAKFYKHFVPRLPDGLSPTCFLMQEDGTNASILLQDLTTSHRQCEDKPVGPSFQDAKAFVAALAHALALNLSRQVRQQWEAVLLELYTETLNLMGVDRKLDVTRNRYRIAVLYGISEPIGIWHAGFPSSVWLPLLTNALDAAADLDVAGLLH